MHPQNQYTYRHATKRMTPRLMFLSADLFHVIPFTFNLQKACKIVLALNTVKVRQHSLVLLKQANTRTLTSTTNLFTSNSLVISSDLREREFKRKFTTATCEVDQLYWTPKQPRLSIVLHKHVTKLATQYSNKHKIHSIYKYWVKTYFSITLNYWLLISFITDVFLDSSILDLCFHRTLHSGIAKETCNTNRVTTWLFLCRRTLDVKSTIILCKYWLPLVGKPICHHVGWYNFKLLISFVIIRIRHIYIALF